MSHTDYETTHDRLMRAEAERDALAADRDQISLTLDVAKADRDKWFNRARDLEAELAEVKTHDAAATSFVQDMVNALGWQERPDGTVSLDDLRDEVLHWLSQVKPTAPETKGDQG